MMETHSKYAQDLSFQESHKNTEECFTLLLKVFFFLEIYDSKFFKSDPFGTAKSFVL